MGRVLIAWATRAGATQDIAAVLGDELRLLGHDVEVADLRVGPDPSGRDLVVLGSGVQAGQWYPEVMAWITPHEAALSTTRVAVFNVCLNAANPVKREESLAYNRAVLARIDVVGSESFAGRYVPERVGVLQRLFLRTLQKPAQDHVDENAVRAWGRELVELVPR